MKILEQALKKINSIHKKQYDFIVIPPKTAHFTIPDKDYVIAVVNTPSFLPERYIKITESDEMVSFDAQEFKQLVGRRRQEKLNQ